MKYVFTVLTLLALLALAGFFLFAAPRVIMLQGTATDQSPNQANTFSVPEAQAPTSSPALPEIPQVKGTTDIPNQSRMQNPPGIVKGIYLTGWSAGSPSRVASLISFMEKRGLNAMVIDIKDYSGYVSYAMDVPDVKASGAENELRILRPNTLLKELHDHNIYVIGRVTVFQDPILAKAHPEWALKNKTTGKAWIDNHRLSWMDPAGQPVWDYVAAIARDALDRGFDEINFDYVRFASDGNLNAIGYPFWNQKTPRHAVIKKFFAYLRSKLPDDTISADLFGLATVDSWDDLGIGQVIEDAYPYFDYVSPMVYPSHYAAGTLNYKNPAAHPYEIIKYSLDAALKRLRAMQNNNNHDNNDDRNQSSSVNSHSPAASPVKLAKLRPWLQAFDLGAIYTPEMIDAQIRAVNDAFSNNSSSTNNSVSNNPITDYYGGWLLWDPANKYSNYRGTQ